MMMVWLMFTFTFTLTPVGRTVAVEAGTSCAETSEPAAARRATYAIISVYS